MNIKYFVLGPVKCFVVAQLVACQPSVAPKTVAPGIKNGSTDENIKLCKANKNEPGCSDFIKKIKTECSSKDQGFDESSISCRPVNSGEQLSKVNKVVATEKSNGNAPPETVTTLDDSERNGITTSYSTWLKVSEADSSSIADSSKKCAISKGATIYYSNKSVSNRHIKVTLDDGSQPALDNCALKSGYLFTDHLENP